MAALAVHNARSYEKQRTAVASLDNERADLAERYGKAEQALVGHAALTRIAIEGGDVDAVATAVRRLIGARAVLLTGPNCRVEEGDRNDLARLSRRASIWTEAAEPVAGKGVELLTAEPDGTCVLEVPVRVGNAVFGQLHLALDSNPGDGAITVAEQAAAVCALLWSREDAATSWVRQLWSELVWDVLDGQMSDGAEFLIRQRHLGLQLEFPARVAIVEVSGLGALAQQDGWDPERLERARAHIDRWIGRQLEQIGVARAPQVHRGDIFAVILPCSATRSLDDVRELGNTLVSHQPRGLWRAAGFSGPAAGPVELAAAFGQARTALASTWRPEHPVGLFEELGVLEFLVSPTGGGSLDRFARQTLGPLLDYDSAHGTCLVPTLAAYLAEDCTAHRAAKRLYVHPKTMQYRMQRIQELTGLQLCNQEDLFQMQLALKILNLGRPKVPAHQPVGTNASK
jgi:sugar diacid utilization regulator